MFRSPEDPNGIEALKEGLKKESQSFLIDFKQFSDRQTDAVKMLGAGNATGLLAIGVLLTSDKHAAPLDMNLAGWCMYFFFGGIAAFVISYLSLFLWFNQMTIVAKKIEKLAAPDDVKELSEAEKMVGKLELYWKVCAGVSFVCFCAGCVAAFRGALRLVP